MLADATNMLPDGKLVIRCDITVIASVNSKVSYDLSPPIKRAKTLESDLKHLKVSGMFSDFQIVCQDECFDVHKAILAVR